MDQEFRVIDWVILIGYFVIILSAGIWSTRKGKNDSLRGFFLASRKMNFFLVGCGLFASNFGSTHFIGLTGSGAKDGIGIAGFELNTIFILLILGWLFVPVYLAGQVYTMPEYLRKRFGGKRIQIYLTVLALILSIFIRTSADLYAGATYIEHIMKWSTYPALLSLLAVSAVFTVFGGLTAVMWTDMVQTFLIVAGAAYVSALTLIEVGGYSVLKDKFLLVGPSNDSFIGYDSNNQSCSQATPYYYNLFRPASDPQFPWTGMTVGLTISAVWGWCTDQVLVQRTLSAKNVCHAKGGCILAGYLKILPLFLFIFPGMAARILFPDEMTCSAPEACLQMCGSPYGCNDIAYPLLVKKLVPAGAKGFVLSVMLSALMSSLSSVFNSSSTLFTIDIWARIRKNPSEMELIVVGKLFTVLMVVISVVWMPVIKLAHGSQLFHYTQSVISYLAPPICSVYVLAVFWSRINEKGAFWGLMAGLIVGGIRFVMDFSYPSPTCSSGLPDERPSILASVHYLHFGCILFFLVCIVTTVVSLLTRPMDDIHIQRLTFWTRYSQVGKIVEDVKMIESAIGKTDTSTTGSNEAVSKVYFVKVADEPKIKISRNKVPATWKRIVYFMCGFGYYSKWQIQPKTKLSLSEDIQISTDLLKEPKKWKIVCDINAIVLFIVAISIFAFYG